MPRIREISLTFSKTFSRNYNSFKVECGMVAELEDGETHSTAFGKLSRALTKRMELELSKAQTPE